MLLLYPFASILRALVSWLYLNCQTAFNHVASSCSFLHFRHRSFFIAPLICRAQSYLLVFNYMIPLVGNSFPLLVHGLPIRQYPTHPSSPLSFLWVFLFSESDFSVPHHLWIIYYLCLYVCMYLYIVFPWCYIIFLILSHYFLLPNLC